MVVGIAVWVQPELCGAVEADGDMRLLGQAVEIVTEMLALSLGEGTSAAVGLGARIGACTAFYAQYTFRISIMILDKDDKNLPP